MTPFAAPLPALQAAAAGGLLKEGEKKGLLSLLKAGAL